MAQPIHYLNDIKNCCDGIVSACDDEKDDELQVLDIISFHHRMNLSINALMAKREPQRAKGGPQLVGARRNS